MQLHSGMAEEYKRRHDALWPELKELLGQAGILDYSIFLDEESNMLVGVLRMEKPEKLDLLSEEAIMKKWWDYMKDIMDTHPDGSPISQPLKEVFYLP